MKITATNKATGEIVELDADNLQQVTRAWEVAQEYDKTAKALKEQLKKLVPQYLSEKGTSEEVNGKMFRVTYAQTRTYDKATLRENLDPDIYELLVKPDKPAVDEYLKENLDALGIRSSIIRQNMVDVGKPVERITLQKVLRDA